MRNFGLRSNTICLLFFLFSPRNTDPHSPKYGSNLDPDPQHWFLLSITIHCYDKYAMTGNGRKPWCCRRPAPCPAGAPGAASAGTATSLPLLPRSLPPAGHASDPETSSAGWFWPVWPWSSGGAAGNHRTLWRWSGWTSPLFRKRKACLKYGLFSKRSLIDIFSNNVYEMGKTIVIDRSTIFSILYF